MVALCATPPGPTRCIASGVRRLGGMLASTTPLFHRHPGPLRAASRRVCAGSEHARRIPAAASDRRGEPRLTLGQEGKWKVKIDRCGME